SEQNDRGSNEGSSECSRSLGRVARTGNRFGPSDHRRNRSAGRSVSIGSATSLLGRGLSWTPGECRGIKQRPLGQRQPVHASASQSACSRSGSKGRLSTSNCFPTPIRPHGIRQSGLGHCPPPLPADLESSSRWSFLRGIRSDTHSYCPQEKATAACDATEQARISGATYPGSI